MKKKLFAVLALVILLSLVLAVTGFACDQPSPCSPGFWKNHTEIWWSAYPEDNVDMLADLRARGPGSAALRYGVADMLNEAFPGANCD